MKLPYLHLAQTAGQLIIYLMISGVYLIVLQLTSWLNPYVSELAF